MKLIVTVAALASALTLAACSGGDNAEHGNNVSNDVGMELNNLDAAAGTLENVADNASGNVAAAVGNQVEAVENAAANLENSAGNAH
jgi:hypothetical protein